MEFRATQHQFHRFGQLMLVPPETFAEQPPGAAAGHGSADLFAGHNAEFGSGAVWKQVPVGDQAAQD